ncbi:carbamoyltransferase C-terminal domain-containing protein [Streptosporangium sp. CA-135522]|uniref:carbamoyltransferase C-terminal domain-containing protein n=1 Tax=Streptosporangium sp. CA-135522 TaxID=3240072 RepID=UPI003D8FAD17
MADLTEEMLADAGLHSAEIDYWISSSTESRNIEEESRLNRILGLMVPPEKSLHLPYPGHHLAHASAAFYSSGFDEAAALVVDAYGSRVGPGRERETAFHFRTGSPPERVFGMVRESDRIAGIQRDGHTWLPAVPNGVGELYRIITLALGFCESGTVYDDAGKTMGLASYGERMTRENLFIDVTPDGGISFARTPDSLVELVLAVREGEELRLIPHPSGWPFERFHHDLAAQIQSEFEEACLHLTRRALATTGSRSLVLSGGCFLNSSLNTRIRRECEIDRLFVFPAATDDGNSAGAALYAYHNLIGRQPPVRSALRHVYLGPSRVAGRDLAALANRWHLRSHQHGSTAEMVMAAAAAIGRGEIVGWFQDRAEFGPRALGARSILCHPGMDGMKDRVNTRVKFRESFRPFAGSVLSEQAYKFFEIPAEESPFMLHICPVLPVRRGSISEIVHVDGTCRIQTVAEDTPGPYRALLEAVERETGLPIVLNTSFNLRGMPIVEHAEDAVDCLYGSRLDRLFIGDVEVEAPDLDALCPVTTNLSTERANCSEAEILALADGFRPMTAIADELGIDIYQAVDAALELRRHGLLRWARVPERVRPAVPLPQYSPSTTI